MHTELSIIIVSYNTATLTLAAIESVLTALKTSKKLNLKTEVIVVDNASKDSSVADIKKRAKTATTPIHILPQRKNLGFARANNAGIEIAKGKYLLFLNSDTIVSPDALDSLYTSLESNPINNLTANDELSSHNDRLGMVAAKLLNPDGSEQYQGGDKPSLVSLAGHLLLLDDIPLLGTLLPSTQHTGRRGKMTATNHESHLESKGWVAATAVMVRRSLIDHIGSFDPAIFMYGEDVEWCLRARHHHWDVAIDHGAEIIHIGSASGSSKRALEGELRGYIYIWSKHFPAWQLPIVKSIIWLGCTLRWVLFGTMGKRAQATLYRDLSKIHWE